MEQQENLLQEPGQHLLGFLRAVADRSVQRKLAHLDVPVTKLMPGKLVKGMRILVKAIGIDR